MSLAVTLTDHLQLVYFNLIRYLLKIQSEIFMRDCLGKKAFTTFHDVSTKQNRFMRTHLIYKSNLVYTYEDNAQKVDALPRSASSSRKHYFTCFIRKLTLLERFIIFTPRFIITASDCSLDALV